MKIVDTHSSMFVASSEQAAAAESAAPIGGGALGLTGEALQVDLETVRESPPITQPELVPVDRNGGADARAENLAAVSQKVAEYGAPVSFNSRTVLFDLYAIMAIIQEMMQFLRNSQRKLRKDEIDGIQKSILAQAEQQEKAANIQFGVTCICATVSMLLSVGLPIAAEKYKASKMKDGVGADKGFKKDMKVIDDEIKKLQGKKGPAAQEDLIGEENKNDLGNSELDSLAGKNGVGKDSSGINNNDAKQIEIRENDNLIDNEGKDEIKLQENKQESQLLKEESQVQENQEAKDLEKSNQDVNSVDLGNDKNENVDSKANENGVKEKQKSEKEKDAEKAKADEKAAKERVESAKGRCEKAFAEYKKAWGALKDEEAAGDKESAAFVAKQQAVDLARGELDGAFAERMQAIEDFKNPKLRKEALMSFRDEYIAKLRGCQKEAASEMAKPQNQKFGALALVFLIPQLLNNTTQAAATWASTGASAEAVRLQAAQKREEENLDQSRDLFANEQQVIQEALRLFQQVTERESQSVEAIIQGLKA